MKNFLHEVKRRYIILTESRDISIVSEDYFLKKWISKEELQRLIIFEQTQMIKELDKLHEERRILLESFNLNALQNYELMERRYQGQIKAKK